MTSIPTLVLVLLIVAIIALICLVFSLLNKLTKCNDDLRHTTYSMNERTRERDSYRERLARANETLASVEKLAKGRA